MTALYPTARVETYRAYGKAIAGDVASSLEAQFQFYLKGEMFRFKLLGPFNVVVSDLTWRSDSVFLFDGQEVHRAPTDSASFLKMYLPVGLSPGLLRELFLQALPDSGQLVARVTTRDDFILSFPDRTYVLARSDQSVRRIESREGRIQFADFENVGGRRLARTVKVTSGEDRYELHIDRQEVNAPIDERLFRIP